MTVPPVLLRAVGPLRIVGTICGLLALVCFGLLLGLDLSTRIESLVLSSMIALAGSWGLAKSLRMLITGNLRIIVSPLLPAAESRGDWQVRLMGAVFGLVALGVLVLGLGLAGSSIATMVQDSGTTSAPAQTTPRKRR